MDANDMRDQDDELRDDAPEELERQIRKIIQLTRASDWMNIEGNPYLCTSGCQIVESYFKIDVVDLVAAVPEHTGEIDDYGFEIVNYEYSARFIRRFPDGGQKVATAVGNASTGESRFMGMMAPIVEWGNDRKPILDENGRTKVVIDHTTGKPKRKSTRGEVLIKVKDQALARCRNSGIRGILQIRSITWGDLEACGISPDDVPKRGDNNKNDKRAQIHPRGQQGASSGQRGAPSGQAAAPREQGEQSATPPMTDEQRKALRAYLDAVGKDDVSAALKAAGATGWKATQPQATAAFAALAALCKERQITDPVTGEVHEPESQAGEAAQPPHTPPAQPPQPASAHTPAGTVPAPAAAQSAPPASSPQPDALNDLNPDDIPF